MIHLIGTNYRYTSLDTREQLALSSQVGGALLQQARTCTGAREAALLSTCNRIELYVVDPTTEPRTGVEALLFATDLEAEGACYHHQGREAVAHLFRVASGLDSMIVGEREIMAQVKQALTQAGEAGHVGPVLSQLFRHALRTGKRARRETHVSSGIFSAGQCAARLATKVLGTLQQRRLLVFGAGRIAHVTAKHMAALGAGPVLIFSRTLERAQTLAHSLEGTAVDGLGLMGALQECDIIVGCATAPHHVVGCRELSAAMTAREGRPLVVVDLGVPRNVDPAVASLPGVHLFNIDDLESVVAEHRESREAEIARVEAIVAEEVTAFHHRQEEREAVEVIVKLRDKAERLRQECLRRAHANGSVALAEADYLTDLLIRKLLHAPLTVLRHAEAGKEREQLAALVEKLFALEEE